MQFTLGCMLSRKRFGVDELTYETLNDLAIQNEMTKITILRDESLTKRSVEGTIGPECARIKITTDEGRDLECFNSVAIGAPTKPMGNEILDDKFCTLAQHAGLGNKTEVLLERLHNLANLTNVQHLWV